MPHVYLFQDGHPQMVQSIKVSLGLILGTRSGGDKRG